MATTTGKRSDQARREIAERMERLTLWKLRDMRRTWHRPRTLRLGKEARALKSLVREAQAVGLVPPQPAPPKEHRGSRAPPW
jgi:hypothetical protein